MGNKVLCLIGETASGKSTIEKELSENGYKKLVSYTTRKIREGEIDGIDYHYVTNEEFDKMKAGELFAEWDEYGGMESIRQYGTVKQDYNNNSEPRIAVLTMCGFEQLKANKIECTSFYIKCSFRIRLIRYISREKEFNIAKLLELVRRSIADAEIFKGIEKKVDYVIDNSTDRPLWQLMKEVTDCVR